MTKTENPEPLLHNRTSGCASNFVPVFIQIELLPIVGKLRSIFSYSSRPFAVHFETVKIVEDTIFDPHYIPGDGPIRFGIISNICLKEVYVLNRPRAMSVCPWYFLSSKVKSVESH